MFCNKDDKVFSSLNNTDSEFVWCHFKIKHVTNSIRNRPMLKSSKGNSEHTDINSFLEHVYTETDCTEQKMKKALMENFIFCAVLVQFSINCISSTELKT